MISFRLLPRLPFIYSHLTSPTNGCGLPDLLPFELGVEPATGRVGQLGQPVVRQALEQAYRDGSRISGQMDGEGLGRQYADDLLKSLPSLLSRDQIKGLRVLEIGCGTGYLLSRFQEMGAKVLGIEPGDHKPLHGTTYPVEVVRDFFPSARVQGKFELILTSMVLEHFEDPVGFVREMIRYLEPGGAISCTVPDSETFITQGDISMLFHEHYSYFTRSSLHNTLLQAGLSSVRIERSSFTNILHSAGTLGAGADAPLAVQAEIDSITTYRSRTESMIDQVTRFIASRRNQGKSIGIYVPGRYANMHVLTDQSPEGLRFFDDNPSLLGTYFPGISIPVENLERLQKKNVDVVLIMSLSFGARIQSKLRGLLPPSVEIVSLSDLVAVNSPTRTSVAGVS